MTSLVADTHAILWYLIADSRLSARAKLSMDTVANGPGNIFVPTIAIVEATYLVEKGRVNANSLELLLSAIRNDMSPLRDVQLSFEIAASLSRIPREIVPDFPDRIIAATALVLGHPLVTADRQIRSSNIVTIW